MLGRLDSGDVLLLSINEMMLEHGPSQQIRQVTDDCTFEKLGSGPSMKYTGIHHPPGRDWVSPYHQYNMIISTQDTNVSTQAKRPPLPFRSRLEQASPSCGSARWVPLGRSTRAHLLAQHRPLADDDCRASWRPQPSGGTAGAPARKIRRRGRPAPGGPYRTTHYQYQIIPGKHSSSTGWRLP